MVNMIQFHNLAPIAQIKYNFWSKQDVRLHFPHNETNEKIENGKWHPDPWTI